MNYTMNYLPFRSHSLPTMRQRQWFEQHLKFEKVIHLVVPICILQMIALPCVHSYDASLGLSQKCKNHCDNNRQPGWKGRYTLDCKQAYSTFEDIDLCTNLCKECPSYLWDRDKIRPHILNCPATELVGTCGDFCDKNRNGNLDGFIIDCKKKFGDSLEFVLCKDACGQCPSWVCNKRTSVFHCPAVKYTDHCEHACNRFRYKLKGFDDSDSDFYDAYQFSCDDLEDKSDNKYTCQVLCDWYCLDSVCQKDKLNRENRKWNCPRKSGPESLPTTTTTPKPRPTSYEGPCKDRCDKYRTGGTGSYQLYCSGLFKLGTVDEKKCVYDCEKCPEKVCPSWQGSRVFYCPESDNHVDWKSKIRTLERINSSQASEITIAVVFAVILALLFTMMASCAYSQFRRRQEQIG